MMTATSYFAPENVRGSLQSAWLISSTAVSRQAIRSSISLG